MKFFSILIIALLFIPGVMFAQTNTPTPSNTPTASHTPTPSMTPTDTPTSTPTMTPTLTPTMTPTSTPTQTPTLTPTPVVAVVGGETNLFFESGVSGAIVTPVASTITAVTEYNSIMVNSTGATTTYFKVSSNRGVAWRTLATWTTLAAQHPRVITLSSPVGGEWQPLTVGDDWLTKVEVTGVAGTRVDLTVSCNVKQTNP